MTDLKIRQDREEHCQTSENDKKSLHWEGKEGCTYSEGNHFTRDNGMGCGETGVVPRAG